MPTFTSTAHALELLGDGVVHVRSDLGTGSGVIFEIADGDSAFVLTNQHLTGRGLSTVTVTTRAGGSYTATVLGRDSVLDLAVVRICCSEEFQAVQFAPSDPEPGDGVYLFGYQLGSRNPTVFERSVTLIAQDGAAGQVSARLNQPGGAGLSGGPITDQSGRILALATYRARPGTSFIGVEDYIYGVPLSTIAGRIDDLKSGSTHFAPTPTPHPSVAFGRYTSPFFDYQVDVPQDWLLNTGNVAKVTQWNPSFGNVVFVKVDGIPSQYTDVEDYLADHSFTGDPEWDGFVLLSDAEISRHYATTTTPVMGHEFLFNFVVDEMEWWGSAHWFISNTAGANYLFQVYALAPLVLIDDPEYSGLEREMILTLVSFGPPAPPSPTP